MARTLTDLGFRVILRTDRTKPQMINDITAFGNELQEDCIALFYFSGHGTQVEGTNYLIPMDFVKRTEQEIAEDAVTASRPLAVMKAKKSRLNLVILDACRNNLFKDLKALGDGGLAPMSAPRGTLIAYATQPGDTASNNNAGKNSLFTQELLKEMKIPGLEVERVLKNARLTVAAKSADKQVPWIEGGLLGDFYFVRAKTDKNKVVENPKPDTLTKINAKDGAEMILIPAGSFLMGDDDQSDNKRRTVTLPAYYIYKNLVTVGQYEKFCQARGKAMPSPPDFNAGWDKKDHPMINVDWEAARAYCKWAGGNLPSEAQWEKAARGKDGRKYPWGDNFDREQLWCSISRDGDAGGTASVNRSERLGKSPYGVLDMAGNVWQWCANWYDDRRTQHVLRGGSWPYSHSAHFRCAYRSWLPPIDQLSTYGFRCVTLSQNP